MGYSSKLEEWVKDDDSKSVTKQFGDYEFTILRKKTKDGRKRNTLWYKDKEGIKKRKKKISVKQALTILPRTDGDKLWDIYVGGSSNMDLTNDNNKGDNQPSIVEAKRS